MVILLRKKSLSVAASPRLAQLRILQQKALEILARAEGAGDLRSALAALKELRGTVELTAKLTGQMAGQGRQSSPDAQYRPYKHVPFEDLVALVDKLDRLQEGGGVVGDGKVITAGDR